jgi:hypothetical protein
MREAVRGGCKAFFLTVDSPTLGNRESDFRAQGLVGDASRLCGLTEEELTGLASCRWTTVRTTTSTPRRFPTMIRRSPGVIFPG